MNLKNKDSIRAIIQGNIVDINLIIEKCNVGPKSARIRNVIIDKIFCKVNYTKFEVKYKN